MARRIDAVTASRRLRWLELMAVLAAAALLSLGGAGSSVAASARGEATIYTGLGLDTCNAPSIPELQAWLASPYRALGIYIGGVNRACSNPQLTPTWISSAEGLGWALAPLYVGPQAPCVTQSGLAKIDVQSAAAEGVSAADDAIAQASQMGLPTGSPIYYDMEAYALDSPSCTQTVQTFLSSWVITLHDQGYVAGVYGSAGSTMRDVQALASTSAPPDDIWIADWNGDTSVFGDPYVSDALWTNHQRIHQFAGSHDESYGGVTLDIDGDAFDGAVVSQPGGAQAPTPNPSPVASTLSTAGSVSSSDGEATVSWPAGAFQRSVVVTLTPSLPATAVPGFGSGGYGVQLAVQQTATSLAASTWPEPLTIHIAPQSGPLAPVFSTNGSSWHALPELVGNLLPLGAQAAFAREADGSIDIQTREAGYFALVPDTTPPPPPARLTAHFSDGALVLDWPASSDAAGKAVSYTVTLTNRPLLTVTGQTSAALHTFHSSSPSVYRVTATDAAGNVSTPSSAVVVLPSTRPKSVPKALPSWAWTVFSWQEQGQIGPRPAAPKILPGWYWKWRAWKVEPYSLRT